jgi:nucleoside-diphosphate-sugar epimerase
MKNIFITGGSGYIGKEICKTLLEQNYNVYAIGRSSKSELENIQWHQYDILNLRKKELLQLLDQKEVIIHNAASLLSGNTYAEIGLCS